MDSEYTIPHRTNNTPATAQLIETSTTVIAGYLDAPSDTIDWYQADLSAGQTLTLMSNSPKATLTLTLYDPQLDPIHIAHNNPSKTSIPHAGRYHFSITPQYSQHPSSYRVSLTPSYSNTLATSETHPITLASPTKAWIAVNQPVVMQGLTEAGSTFCLRGNTDSTVSWTKRCSHSGSNQLWLITEHNQLLHLATNSCIEYNTSTTSEINTQSNTGFRLNACDSTNAHQQFIFNFEQQSISTKSNIFDCLSIQNADTPSLTTATGQSCYEASKPNNLVRLLPADSYPGIKLRFTGMETTKHVNLAAINSKNALYVFKHSSPTHSQAKFQHASWLDANSTIDFEAPTNSAVLEYTSELPVTYITPDELSTSGIAITIDRSALPTGHYESTLWLKILSADGESESTQDITQLLPIHVQVEIVEFVTPRHEIPLKVAIESAEDGISIPLLNKLTGNDNGFFSLPLPTGRYSLTLGSDLNKDGILCDGIELCGKIRDIHVSGTSTVFTRETILLSL